MFHTCTLCKYSVPACFDFQPGERERERGTLNFRTRKTPKIRFVLL
jgi:hypothetical protein